MTTDTSEGIFNAYPQGTSSCPFTLLCRPMDRALFRRGGFLHLLGKGCVAAVGA